jgi:hypothetical protein
VVVSFAANEHTRRNHKKMDLHCEPSNLIALSEGLDTSLTTHGSAADSGGASARWSSARRCKKSFCVGPRHVLLFSPFLGRANLLLSVFLWTSSSRGGETGGGLGAVIDLRPDYRQRIRAALALATA